MELRRAFRWSARSSKPSCPRCGSPAPEGLVMEEGGGAACLPCSILRILGQQEVASRSPKLVPLAPAADRAVRRRSRTAGALRVVGQALNSTPLRGR